MTDLPAELTEMTTGVRQLVPLFDFMQLEVTEAGNGRAGARIPLQPNGNHFGAVYAGSLFSLSEMLGGIIGLTSLAIDGFIPIVKDLKINFLRPAMTGVVATAELGADEIERVRAEALDNGKAEYVLTTEVTDENGTVVARTVATYQIRKM